MKPPFLRRVWMDRVPPRDSYPFTLPFFGVEPFNLEFDAPITVLVGENGCGKSTLLEAIASHLRFNLGSGSRHQTYTSGDAGAANALRARSPSHGCPR